MRLFDRDWKEIDALFSAALDQPKDERDAFVRARCGGDEELYRIIRELLDASEAEASPFDVPAHEHSEALWRALASDLDAPALTPDAHLAVQQIGPYGITGELGRGGSGVVYRAERADGAFEQTVAIKILDRRAHADAMVRRFRQEQQVLADLSHPHIARLLDGGITSDDRPYLVMEYVDGQPVVDYCDALGLTVRDRLLLFVTIAETVHFAHRNLIVHRDLKPSNIFVTAEDADANAVGTAKLLDFGIAKVLDDEAPGLTRTGERWMTPEYAAPEQVQGMTITTATDIYQLGILLYELLTGHRPYQGRSSSFDIQRAICEEDPARPSTIVTETVEVRRRGTTITITPQTVSTARGTVPGKLRQTLSGDLDAIILKALRKEPDQRYSSAEALADDVRLYLDGHPVDARRGSWIYRSHKFVRRHAAGVATASVAFLLIAGLGLFHTQRVAAERDRAQLQAQRAQAVSDYLTDLFEASDPHIALGDSVTAQNLLARGVAQIDSLDQQPDIQAQLLFTFGSAYRSAGQFELARTLLERASQLQPTLSSESDSLLAGILRKLAVTARDQGNHDRADSLFRAAIALHRQQSDSSGLAVSLSYLGYLQRLQGNYADAEATVREALALQRILTPGASGEKAETLYILASIIAHQGRYDQALSIYQESLAILDELVEGPHPGKIANLNNIAITYDNTDQVKQAAATYREALEMARVMYDDDHPQVATSMMNLGNSLVKQGFYEEADTLLNQALTALRNRYGDDHPDVASPLHNLGHLHSRSMAYASGERYLREALAIKRAYYDGAHPNTATTLQLLGIVLAAQDKLEEAETSLREALAMRRARLDPRHPEIANSLHHLASLYARRDRCEAALPLFEEALSIRNEAIGSMHWLTADTKSDLGECLLAMRRYADAAPLLQEALTVFEDTQRPEYIQQTRRRLVALYDAWNRPDAAAQHRKLLAQAPEQ